MIKEIHDLCDFRITYRTLSELQPLDILTAKTKLIKIKNNLIEYKQIRNRGYSDDFLASEIGHLVFDVNSIFRR